MFRQLNSQDLQINKLLNIHELCILLNIHELYILLNIHDLRSCMLYNPGEKCSCSKLGPK